jgi:SpoVK/Ycf46/Vps4 family AAA+-type ATPase
MDGVAARKQIYVVGATNRPDMIDAAMLRPGRLDKLLYVPLPDAQGRASILMAVCEKPKISFKQLTLVLLLLLLLLYMCVR